MCPTRTSVRAKRGGFSLLELVVVMAILAVSLSMFATTLGASMRLDPVSLDKAVAAEAARTQLEEMRNHPFAQIFALYNDNPNDDPGGAGTAPGSHFFVKDLTPVSAGTLVGRVTFPTVGNQLREDVVDSNLGTPRDLNGDGAIDGDDHSADRIILPVRVTIEWIPTASRVGKRNFTMYTMFSAL